MNNSIFLRIFSVFSPVFIWQLSKRFLNRRNVSRVRKACRAQMKFELLQKHSRQVKFILHFGFFMVRIFYNFVHKIHKQKKQFSLLRHNAMQFFCCIFLLLLKIKSFVIFLTLIDCFFRIPDLGSQTHIFDSLMTKFWVRSTIILSFMAKKKFLFSVGVVVGSGIRNG